jgi:hypothetical protein
MMKRLASFTRVLYFIGMMGLVGCRMPWATEEMMTVPAGTMVEVALNTRLSTDTNHSGDRFEATTLEAIVVEDKTVAPAGAEVHGVLSNVEASGRVEGRAKMTLQFTKITDPEGGEHTLSTKPISLQAKSGTRGDVEKIAGGGIVGAIIGGLTGGGKGAAIGGVIGAGAGTVWVLATKGDDIELPPGQRLQLRITEPTDLPVVARKTTRGGE